jgi:guanylate kinase
MSKGFLVIISGPSGSGKSTICRKLRQRDASLRYSISYSTRKPRPSEIDGTHYNFLSLADFKKKSKNGAMLESAQVHGNYYGTPRAPIEKAIAKGDVVLLDIDTRGAETIRRKRPDAVTIFLLPPTLEALKERLHRRNDTHKTMTTRLANAREELRHTKHYTYWVINDSLSKAVRQIEAIILAERIRSERHGLKGTKLGAMIRA